MIMPLLSCLVAYLLGSIPFGLLLVRVFQGKDLRRTGSGNIGATNALRSGGKALGIATLALDLAKGVAGVAAGWALAGEGTGEGWKAAIAAAPVLGHCFPVWLRFRGGKGVATALGVLLATDVRLAGAGALAFFVLALPSRYVSLGSVAAALATPVAAFVIWGFAPMTLAIVVVAGIVLVRHRENIGRLIDGTESKVGSSRAS